jgi:hypothetical protein
MTTLRQNISDLFSGCHLVIAAQNVMLQVRLCVPCRQLHQIMEASCLTKASSGIHFVYYCSFYLIPFRCSNSNYGYIGEGESTVDYTSFPCPGI